MQRSPRLETLEGASLAFVSNNKRNNESLVRALAAEIERRSAGCTVSHWHKSSPYRALARKTAKVILAECNAAVLGPGD